MQSVDNSDNKHVGNVKGLDDPRFVMKERPYTDCVLTGILFGPRARRQV
jgi:hypothetical protein